MAAPALDHSTLVGVRRAGDELEMRVEWVVFLPRCWMPTCGEVVAHEMSVCAGHVNCLRRTPDTIS